jgi:hypothetical protein
MKEHFITEHFSSNAFVIRGDYNRAWNTVDPRIQSVELTRMLPIKDIRRANSARPKSHGTSQPQPALTSAQIDMRNFYFKDANLHTEAYMHEEPPIVDLMFEPGKLMPAVSPEALAYKRFTEKSK